MTLASVGFVAAMALDSRMQARAQEELIDAALGP